MGKWRYNIKISDCLKILYGKDQRLVADDDKGIYPILGTGGIMGYAKQYLYNKPSVLIGRKGTIDEPQYMETPFWTIDTLYYTEIYPENDAKFLYYVFQSIPWKNYNEATGVPSLAGSTINRINVSLPANKKEQRKIAEILTTIDEAIDNSRTLIEKYTNIKTGMMQDLLTNGVDEHGTIRSSKTHKYKDSPLGRIPDEWDIVDLFEWSTKQSDSIVDGPFGSNLKLIHYRDDGIPVIQSGFVTTGKFVAKKYVFVDEYKFMEQYRCRAYPLDIIISKIGAQCGRCAVLPISHPVSIIAGNCIKMTVNKNYNPYLLHELLSYYYQLGYFDFIRSVTAQPAINLTKLKKLKVIFMQKEEQERIYHVISSVNNKIQTERDYLAKLQDIKKGLMQDLLTNTISVEPLL